MVLDQKPRPTRPSGMIICLAGGFLLPFFLIPFACLENAPYHASQNSVPATIKLNFFPKTSPSSAAHDTIALHVSVGSDTIISKKYPRSAVITDTLELPVDTTALFHARQYNGSTTLLYSGDTSQIIPHIDYAIVTINMALVAPSPTFTDTLLRQTAVLGHTYLDTLRHSGPAGVARTCSLLLAPPGMTLADTIISWVPSDSQQQNITILLTDPFSQSDTLRTTITVIIPDTESPIVVITSPANTNELTTFADMIDLSGTAFDDQTIVTVDYVLSGATSASGTATGTNTWSIGRIALDSGITTITVTAIDSSGNQGRDSIVITRQVEAEKAPGLVAYYPFNGNPNDESGNAHHGIAYNNPSRRPDRFGNALSAYHFGAGNRIYADIDSSHFNTNALTISCWVNHDTISARLMRYVTLGQEAAELRKRGPTPAAVAFLSKIQSTYHTIIAYDMLSAHQWFNVVGTWDRGTQRLYVNGKQEAVRSAVRNLSKINKLVVSQAGGQFMEGLIDDIRIYNYALSPTQIDSLYRLGGWPQTEDTATLPTAFQADANTIALWHFDETSGDTAFDASGNEYHAIVSNKMWGAGKFDGGLLFSGEKVVLANSERIDLGGNFTIDLWLNMHRYPSSDSMFYIIGKYDWNPGKKAWTMVITDQYSPTQALICDLYDHSNNNVVDVESPVPLNTWIKVSMQLKDHTYHTLYVNDSLVNLDSVSSYGGIPMSTVPITMGNNSFFANAKNDFYGRVDDVRISNVARYGRPSRDIRFSKKVIHSTDKDFKKVIARDLDQDGDMDILSASYGHGLISWYENKGTDVFTRHTITKLTYGARSIVVADVDKDGNLDVVSCHDGLDDKIIWHQNNGNENFSSRIVSSSPTRLVAAVDLDGDNDVDIVSSSTTNVVWHENQGSQTFVVHTVSDSSTGLAGTADLDKDGDMDILLSDPVGWCENDRPKAFAPKQISAVSSLVFPVDFDLDGDVDLVQAKPMGWYENNAGQTFTFHAITSDANNVSGIFCIDIDGDQDVDIVTSEKFKIAWYENTGTGSFATHIIEDGVHPSSPTSVFAADVDGDGIVDVLATNASTGGKVSWYKGYKQ